MRRILTAAIAVIALTPGRMYCGVLSGDSLIVESRSVSVGATDVDVRLRFVNSLLATNLAFPLEVRSLSPGYLPTTACMTFDERMLNHLTGIQGAAQFPQKNGVCGESGEAAYWTPVSRDAGDTVAITGTTWGLLFVAIAMTIEQRLPPGADSLGSFIISFGLPDSAGAFEIDSTCTAPNNHVQYISLEGEYAEQDVAFVPGVVTVVSCGCEFHGDLDGSGGIDATDLAILIDYVFFGVGNPTTDPGCPHVDRGDVNCDGFDDALDITVLIDYINFGGAPPCDPCACDPYPSGCP